MYYAEILSILTEVIKLIAFGSIGGAVASWFFNKKLQTQKHEHDKQLAALESKLEKKNTVHKLQFEKEFKLYEELWKALVEVRKTAVITPSVDNIPTNKSPFEVYKERYEIAVVAFNNAKNLFEDHRPFYHEDVSKITKDLLSQCRRHIRSVSRMLSYEDIDKLYEEADEQLKKIPDAIDIIEKAIKQRIGLLQKAEIVE